MSDAHAAAPPNDTEARPSRVRGSTRRWLLAVLPGLVGVGLSTAGRLRPDVVEAEFARGVYPRIADTIGQVGIGWGDATGAADLSAPHVSASEALIVGLALCVLWRVVVLGRRGIGGVARFSLRLAGSLYLCFVLAWGLNYARLPLADALDLDVGPVSDTALYETAMSLHSDLVALLDECEPYQLELREHRASVGCEAVNAWHEATSEEPELGRRRRLAVVAPAASLLLVRSGISGIFSPFTQECHVAGGQPQDDLIFAACHELAHAHGWAREDEANYLAWRVASRSRLPVFRRAAYLIALRHVLVAATRGSRSMAMLISSGLDPRVVELLGQRRLYWETTISETATRTATRVNDAYLKSQGQDGVASYGRMVDLLVAERRTLER